MENKVSQKKLSKIREGIKLILSFFIFLYIGCFIPSLIMMVSRPLLFKHQYSYENIKLHAANSIDEIEVSDALKNVYNNINRSSLYKKDSDYVVFVTNTKNTELLYFMSHNILTNIKNFNFNIESFKIKNLTNISQIDGLSGYVRLLDFKAIAFSRELNESTISHELGHQMMNRALKDPIIKIYSKRNIQVHEGYAQLIAYSGDIELDEYNGSEFMGQSSYSVDQILHDDGKYYTHRQEIMTYPYNFKGSDDGYSIENMFALKSLLLEDDILSLVKGINTEKRLDEESNKLQLNHLQSRDLIKSEGSYDALEGTWIDFECENEETPCRIEF